jgi:L-serine dehydratase
MKSFTLPVLTSGAASGEDTTPSTSQRGGNPRTYSILDNVLGPVGRGPSSSHTMAPHRASLEAFGVLGGAPDLARVQFLNSFATTGEGHRSHVAVAAGLLGLAPEDKRFPRALEAAREAGLEIQFEHEVDYAEHPNTIYMELRRGDKWLNMKVISTGGGNYDIQGDCTDQQIRRRDGGGPTVPTTADARLLRALPVIRRAVELSRPTWRAYADLAAELGVGCAEFALLLEAYVQINKGGLQTIGEVWDAVDQVLRVMLAAVAAGSADRQTTQVTPGDWGTRLIQADTLFGDLWHAFVGGIAAQEYNAGMGVVAAAPTGGASGTLPGVLYGLMKTLDAPAGQLIEALLVAGLVGLVAFSRGPVSGAQSGCGGEIGVAAMMAAGAASHLRGGGWEEADAAAALAGQLFVGLECSPVGGNVEYPCIPRNGFAAVVAIAAAEAAGAGVSPPHYGLDETLDRIFAVGSLLPRELRETEDGHWAGNFIRMSCCGQGGCRDCPVPG